MKDLERWKAEMPTEEEMRPKDKYTIFDRKEKRYRKGIHSELGFLGRFLKQRHSDFCAWTNPYLSLWEGSTLTVQYRATQMDASQSTNQPSWVLT